MFTSFDELDRRRQITFLDQYSDSNGNIVNISPHVAKYWDQVGEPTVGRTANDIPFFRYADILLLHAEAINALRNGSNAEALQVINTVRARARFDGQMNQSVLPDLIPMKKDDFRNAILEERKRELAWEGHRWFDLVRMGVLKEIVTLAKPDSKVTENHNLLPIPQRELTINPGLGEQNPGY